MFKDATKMIRDYIAAHGREFDVIINRKEFATRFIVKGEALKNVPRGYDAYHPQAEYLKNKSWYLEYLVTDGQVVDTDSFLRYAAQLFRYMKPFNDYLNTALKGFTMPSR